MADIINRNNPKDIQRSVGVYDKIKYLKINGMTLPSCNNKYWKIENDLVLEMTNEEKVVVDNTEIEAAKYIIKSKNKIMSELWSYMIPILTDTIGKRRVGDTMPPVFEDYIITPKDTPEILAIKQARADRWQAAMLTASFQTMSLQLDGNDYTNARARGQELVALNVITNDDYIILDNILPLVK